ADAGAPSDLLRKWAECQRRGAVALLTLQPKGQTHLATRYQVHVESPTLAIPCISVLHEAAEKLFPKANGTTDSLVALESALTAGDKPKPQSRPLHRKARLQVSPDHTPITGRNLLAGVPGRAELAKEAILVSTHHDHLGIDSELLKAGKDGIFNGADDNASGCAALLLLAQALHADRERLPASYRTVIFASFDAEEQGLVGSR